MTPEPDSLEPDVEVADAALWMLAAGYRHLPVVTDGQVIGMLSIKDIMWALTGDDRGLHERSDHVGRS
jgi:CBS domain-containing protein